MAIDQQPSIHHADGRAPAAATVARVMLRPIGSPLPLGALALVPSGLLLAGTLLGVFFLAVGAIFAMLIGGGLAGGKAAAGAVILMGSARFVLSGLYELLNSKGLEHAAGIVGLAFVVVAAYVGFATLLEDSARRSILPIGRRGAAREAFAEGLNAQLIELEHEAGVREQLEV